MQEQANNGHRAEGAGREPDLPQTAQVKVDADGMGDSETYLIGGMSRGAAIRLIGRIAHVHHLDVRIRMRAGEGN